MSSSEIGIALFSSSLVVTTLLPLFKSEEELLIELHSGKGLFPIKTKVETLGPRRKTSPITITRGTMNTKSFMGDEEAFEPHQAQQFHLPLPIIVMINDNLKSSFRRHKTTLINTRKLLEVSPFFP